jgi:hypothetical protein
MMASYVVGQRVLYAVTYRAERITDYKVVDMVFTVIAIKTYTDKHGVTHTYDLAFVSKNGLTNVVGSVPEEDLGGPA